jgi:PIN domain-containing protein
VNRPAKPAPVQFYLDADVLGLAKILVQIRGDVTYPGDPGGKVKGGRVRAPCSITDRATRDDVWIPETARQGWLIITRDRHIQEHRAEISAVKASGARLVTLAGAEAVDTFHQMEALMCNWRQIMRLLDRPGPFIYIATRTTLRELPL